VLSIIIPAFNEAHELPRTVNSLRDSIRDTFPYEIIVGDNDSSDQTAEVATSLGCRVVHEPHRQIARARNAGVRAANGRWLLFVDADTRVSPNLMDALHRHIEGGQVGMIGATVQFDTPRLQWFPSLVVGAWNRLSIMTKWAAGSFLACRRDGFDAVGGFDTRYYAGEEIKTSIKLHRWCRSQKLKAVIESSTPVLTSARKIEGKSTRTLIRQLAILRPGALINPASCQFWYDPKWRHSEDTSQKNSISSSS